MMSTSSPCIWLFFTIVYQLIILNANPDTECARHRKPWHLLSNEEQMQFVNAFKQLRLNGKLSIFATTHHNEGTIFEDIHKTSEFFYWHSYFIWEFETQIRNLGDEYKCFSLPYWDITNDAPFVTTDVSSYLPIFNSNLGCNGNENNNHCIEDTLWDVNSYKTEFLCASSEILPNCCLKRQRNAKGYLPNINDFVDSFKYKRYHEFQDSVNTLHGDVHKFMADSNHSHFWSNNAAEDPLFVLFHSFVEYIRVMRTDCWNYDKIALKDIHNYIPYSYDSYISEMNSGDENIINSHLDTVMDFTNIGDSEWSLAYQMDISSRMIYDISLWNVSYELGSFWGNSNQLQTFCGDNINNTWFYNSNNQNNYIYNKQQILKLNNIKNKLNLKLIYLVITISCCILFIFCFYFSIRNNVYKESVALLNEDINKNNNNYYGSMTHASAL